MLPGAKKPVSRGYKLPEGSALGAFASKASRAMGSAPDWRGLAAAKRKRVDLRPMAKAFGLYGKRNPRPSSFPRAGKFSPSSDG